MYNNGNSSKNVTGASVVDGTLENADYPDNGLSGDKIDGGIISNFQSTGIDDRLPTGKILTLSTTGADIDGSVTCDGLTVDGPATISQSTQPLIYIKETDTTNLDSRFMLSGGNFYYSTVNDDNTGAQDRLKINNTTGDVDIYKDLTVAGNFASTGIDDNATSTAITIDNNEEVIVSGQASNGGILNVGDNAAYRGILAFSGAGNTSLTISNSYDNASARMDFKLRTAGTPVTALQVHGSGNVTVPQGDIRLSTSGKGIDFSGVGTAAEILDDYEEGTWTPVFKGTSGSVGSSSTSQSGTSFYTKIGRQVYIECYIRWADLGSWTGVATVEGLPFAAASGSQASLSFGDKHYVDFKGGTNISGYIPGGTSLFYFLEVNSDTAVTYLDYTAFDNANNYIMVSGTYLT
jgi:hypothetical protein